VVVEFPIDMRSDLVTRPTPQMVEAMADAATQPQGFGFRENKHVRKIEQLGAALLGKEDALFCPSCTLCNQIAVNVGTMPGDTVLVEANSHIVVAEMGAPAALSGVMIRQCQDENGVLSVETLTRSIISDRSDGALRCAMLVIENTHTRNGGRVMSTQTTAVLSEICHAEGILVHLDGARLFNAAAALDAPVSDLTAHVDTVSISLNKGLCAPVGAILAGSRDFISRAENVRQRFGGGWRPAGVVAAAGIVALEQMPKTLVQDHARAKQLAEQISCISGLTVTNSPVQTNIVSVSTDGIPINAHGLVEHLSKDGVLALAFSSNSIRFVTHHDIRDEDVDVAAKALRRAVVVCGANSKRIRRQ